MAQHIIVQDFNQHVQLDFLYIVMRFAPLLALIYLTWEGIKYPHYVTSETWIVYPILAGLVILLWFKEIKKIINWIKRQTQTKSGQPSGRGKGRPRQRGEWKRVNHIPNWFFQQMKRRRTNIVVGRNYICKRENGSYYMRKRR